MALNPLAAAGYKSGTALAQPVLNFGNVPVSVGGVSSSLGVTAATVVKASPGILREISFAAGGTGATAWVFNDSASTAAATNAGPLFNQILSVTSTAATVSGAQTIVLNWPCKSGITVSQVPGAGSPAVNISFD